MFGSDIIEVAIGMAFLYLFMSMIASALREALEGYMKKRAADLEKGLREMLRTDTTASGVQHRGLTDILRGLLPAILVGPKSPESPRYNTWAGQLYAHPIIASLFAGTYEEAKRDNTLPSYVPKESFSLALLDFIAGDSAKGQVLSLSSLKAALDVPQPNDVQRVVLTAISNSQDDILKVRKAIEDWYDATMDRVSGWYARRTAGILFLIGFGAAVALNVDSISVVRSLLTDRPLRQAIVAKAEAYTKAEKDREVEKTNKTQEAGKAEAGKGVENPAVPAEAGAQGATGQSTAAIAAKDMPPNSFERLRAEMDEVGFPIGWTWKEYWPMPIPQSCVRKPAASTAKADREAGAIVLDCSRKNYVWMMLLAIMGWLITAIAIMLGAPFWFDILNKLISIRTALKPPEDTKPGKKIAAANS